MNSGETMSQGVFLRLLLAVAVGLSLSACQDTKAREENEQLKAHVLQLQKDAGELGNRIDVLTKENADLKAEIARLKARHPAKKTPAKGHRRTTKPSANSEN
jgi:regulator of replication initiation timing